MIRLQQKNDERGKRQRGREGRVVFKKKRAGEIKGRGTGIKGKI